MNEYVCNPGKYLPKLSRVCSDCLGGSFCPGGTYSYNEESDQGIDQCAVGSYSSANSSSCTACTGGKTTNGIGKTSCNADCNNKNNVSTWETANWNNNTVSNLCKISSCQDYYSNNNNSCVISTTLYTKSFSFANNQEYPGTITENLMNKSYLQSQNGNKYSFVYFQIYILLKI